MKREGVNAMIRIVSLGMLAFVLSFFVATTVVHGQTTTITPTTTVMTTPAPTISPSNSTPAAPNTGFGN